MRKDMWVRIAVMAIFGGAACALTTDAQGQKDNAPNILLILVDDVGYADIGAFSARINRTTTDRLYYETPRIDQLAREGTMFTQFYACTVCAPTRSSLMTGKMNNRMGMWDAYAATKTTFEKTGKPVPDGCHILDHEPWDEYRYSKTDRGVSIPIAASTLHDVKTIPQGLKGYHSVFTGKWHLGSQHHPGYRPEDQGFDQTLAYFDGGGSGYHRPFRAYAARTRQWDKPGPRLIPQQDYLSDDVAQRVNRFLEDRAIHHAGEPFFLYLAHPAAHGPIQSRADDLAYFEKKAQTAGWIGHKNPAYAGLIKGMDRSIGEILDKLDELKLSDNTAVVFISDNGGHPVFTRNTPLRGGKSMLYEGGVRVPMIVRWPGKTRPGTLCDVTSDIADIYPTLMDIAGVDYSDYRADSTTDGESLAPLFGDLENKKRAYTRNAFYQFYGKLGYKGFHSFATWATLRKGDYKLHYDYHGKVELYNIAADMCETNDLVKAKPELALDMLVQLTDWLKANCNEAYLPQPNPQFDPRGELPYGPYVPLEQLKTSLINKEYRTPSPGNTTYYIDPAQGSDDRSGTGRTQAWRTFGPVNQLYLGPGDRVEIMAPGSFDQTLMLTGEGTALAPVEIRFAPGRYDLFPARALTRRYQISNTNGDPDTGKAIGILLDGARHVKLSGPGAVLFYRGKMIEVCIDGCQDIMISDLQFDYHRPTVSEFRVATVRDAYVEMQVHPDSHYTLDSGQITWQGEGWSYQTGLAQELDLRTNEVWRRRDPLQGLTLEQIKPFLLRARGKHDMKPQHVYQIRNTRRDCAGVFTRRSRNITWKDVQFRFLHGMGLVNQFSENLTFDRVTIAPDEKSGRSTAAWADCIQVSGCRGKLLVKGCVFSGAHDDAINIHGTHLRVIECLSDRQIKLRFMHAQTFGFMAFNPGDDIEFVAWDSLRPYASNRVTAAELVNPKEMLLTLERPVPQVFKEKDVVENVTWTPEVEIRGCTVTRIPTRGFLITTRRKVLVQDNVFNRTHMSAILLEDDARGWFESGCVRDMTITGNRFVRCAEPVIHINPQNSVPNDAVHQNIQIEGNEFVLRSTTSVKAQSTRGLRVTGNTIRSEKGASDESSIKIRDCSEVKIENNHYVPVKQLPIQGEVFTVAGRMAFLILPAKTDPDEATPWVWYAPTLQGLPGKAETWMFDQFLAKGIAIAGVDVGESYGSPRGRALYSALYRELVDKRGLSKKACLLARSRGGLMLYNWAVEHPACVACIAGIYPVCNLSSYPGLARACSAYDLTEAQLGASLSEHNPIDRLAPLAAARVPIFHIHGDTDTVVPLDRNSAVVKTRYDSLGGPMTLELVKGQGHNMWPGWFHSQALVDFVIANARGGQAGPCTALSVTDLRCEYLSDPLGIDVQQPRFSWKLIDAKKTRGQKQTAYQILVTADSPDDDKTKNDLWDSGKVDSATSVNVVYDGVGLSSNQNCFWKLRVWDKDGQVTGWSPEARFSMGLLQASDWQGEWIRYKEADTIKHIWYRKSFSLETLPLLGFVYLCSIGYHELYVNGQRIGTRVLSPGITNLEKRALYVTYDITGQLKTGNNVIAVWTGPGWARADGSYGKGVWKQDSIFKCQVNLSNGLSLHSDTSWKCRISSSENLGLWKGGGRGEYGGERIDARQHIPCWNQASFDDAQWANASVYAKSLILSAEMMEPDRKVEALTPVAITEHEGLYTADMGRNFTGWLEVKLRKGKLGQTVKFMTANQPGKKVEFKQESHYIHDARGTGTFCHRFNYMAGRWITIEGLSYKPRLQDISCYIVTNDRTRTGHFECSNELFNRIYETDLRTYIANTVNGVLMDCPHRERYGYGEVSFACMWGCGIPNYESAAFYTKATRDWFDVQREDGFVNTIAPQVYRGAGGTLWSSAPVTMSWEFYRAYGDRRQLVRAYGPMKKWLDYLHGYVSDDGVLTPYTGASRFLGDWATPHGSEYGNIPAAKLFNNCVYAYNLDVFVQAARILGKPQAAAIYAQRLADLRRHAHTHFFNEKTKTYIDGRQLSMAFPLYTGITPDHERMAVFANFVKEITVNKPYLDTGSPGLPILLKYIIEDVERPDLLVHCLTRTEQPGYGYFLSEGQTTWPEYWQIVGHDSKIHTCYTSIAGYFIRGIGGIRPDPEEYGMKQFFIKPNLVGDLSYANTRSASLYGPIVSNWSRSGTAGRFHFEVPPNTTAKVYVPAGDLRDVLEAERPAAQAAGVSSLGKEGKYAVFSIESGAYDFFSASVPARN